jgi:hypothetical protein
MLWSDDETMEVMIFVQGLWTEEVLLLQRPEIASISMPNQL